MAPDDIRERSSSGNPAPPDSVQQRESPSWTGSAGRRTSQPLSATLAAVLDRPRSYLPYTSEN